MIPVAASGPGLPPPSLRLEPPALELPATEAVPEALGAEVLTYTSTGNALDSPLGTMRLSANFAAFEHHKGSMMLEFTDVLPGFPGYRIASEFLKGASVYRVTNAEQYFLENPTICSGKPLRFIVTKVTSLADIKGGTTAVSLWLLSLENYADFGPATFDPCGGDTYKADKIGAP